LTPTCEKLKKRRKCQRTIGSEAGNYSSRAKTPKTAKATKTNVANVTEIIGSGQWRAEFASGSFSTQARESLLLHEYMNNLSDYDYNVAAYPIREGIGKAPKYYLIFCTRHPDGVKLMNSFIREEEDELLKDSTTTPNQLLLPSEEFDIAHREVHRRRKELYQLVSTYLQENHQTTRGQIRHHFIFERFGDFHDKDYNFVVKELIQAGKLQTGHGRKSINDEEPLTFIP